MKVIIALIAFFSGIDAFNACAQGMDQHMQIVNQQLDQIEGIFPSNETPATSFRDQEHSFSVNSQTFYSRSSESQKTRTVAGVWGGVEGKYIMRPPQSDPLNTPLFNYYAVEGLFATGKNKLFENEQRASDNSITRLTLKNIPGYMFDNRILIGKDFITMPSIRMTPYTGFGIRYKTDQSAGHYDVYDNYLGSPVVALGYNFSDLYYYVPVGLDLDIAENSEYGLSWNIEYDNLLRGYEKDDYANFDQFTLPVDGFTNQNLRYTFDHGFGIRSSLKFIEHVKFLDIYFEPYIRYWHIDASKAATGLVGGGEYTASAPKNNSLEVGSSIGIKFY